MARAFARIAFTPSVLDVQDRQGSKKAYASFLIPGEDSGNKFTEAEASFIQARDSFYQASVSNKDWPYVQYRGGPTGFLTVQDEQTLAYADFRGNRQYISAGNLKENNQVSLILMDYPNRRRLKIYGRAHLTEIDDDPKLVASLTDDMYRAKPERAVIIKLEAFDWNCPQHIHPRFTATELDPYVSGLTDQIKALETENRALTDKIKHMKPLKSS